MMKGFPNEFPFWEEAGLFSSVLGGARGYAVD